MEVVKSSESTLDEEPHILILKCKKCGWSFRADRDRLEIADDEFRCGRCLENIAFKTTGKSCTNMID